MELIINDVKYNAKKSHVMIIRCKDHRRLVFPDFYLCGAKLDICKEVKYLGHFFTDDLLPTSLLVAITNRRYIRARAIRTTS